MASARSSSTYVQKQLQMDLRRQSRSLFKLSSMLAVTAYLLAHAQQTVATLIYGQELSTETDMQFDHPDVDPFPTLGGRLGRDCGMIITATPPNKTFVPTSSPQCTWDGVPDGTMVNITIEEGKNLSIAFKACMNRIMQDLCSTYEVQRHSGGGGGSAPSSDLPIALIVIGVTFGVCLIVIAGVLVGVYGCSKSKPSSGSSTGARSSYSGGSSYSSDTTIAMTTYTSSDTYSSPAVSAPSSDHSGVTWS